MKRSNRLVLLVGVFLAIVAFIGVILLMQGGGGGGGTDPNAPVTEVNVVVAKNDCKQNGWMNYGNLFKNQGTCLTVAS